MPEETGPGPKGPGENKGVESRILLKRLSQVMAEPGEGQERLDRITAMIARSLATEVCSVYLKRDEKTLELCSTEGLRKESVHVSTLRVGQGLVGRIAEQAEPVNTADAPNEKGFRYLKETGEELYSSFLGVPIQRVGEVLGVLVVQTREPRAFTEDEIHGLEIVAMVIAEMTELGAFIGPGAMEMAVTHRRPFFAKGLSAQEGVCEGTVILHEPNIVASVPVAEDPEVERARLLAAVQELRLEVDRMLENDMLAHSGEHREVLETYRLFAHDKGWLRRMEESIDRGLSAILAVEKEQSATRTRMERITDPYLRERLHDLDDIANRLLRHVAGQQNGTAGLPEDAVLVARSIGPGDLLDYGRSLRGVVLEEGSVGSHAAVVARALAIPLVIQAARITREAQNGDRILVDGDEGVAHLRPEETVYKAFHEKVAMRTQAKEVYTALRDLPAETLDGTRLNLMMNAGLMADLPSLGTCGAEGVGLYRTELQFLVRSSVPRRSDQAGFYSRVLDAAKGKRVIFRTLDIGSDKVLPYMKRQEEPNPALGWRAIRVGLDRRGVMRMQLQALLRGAKGRPLSVMFPFVAQLDEFETAREMLLSEVESERAHGRVVPESLEIGAMLETPSLAFAPDEFFRLTDFISIGGNDLKQFFFAADRENERVRRRYDTLNVSFLTFIEMIVKRCEAFDVPLSFCGEDAGRPIEALAFAAMGLRSLSMRPASIGPVKRLLRSVDLSAARQVIDSARRSGTQSVRPALSAWLTAQNAPV
ncbi:phosphoenolpyruvate--protein phosphotransferase [Paroceanicella profunda]|uniref:phosphoenolpyruvate--protein phosphotransferase n=1 Tax=Paroceanicella profunda TaxID=2579971 RepID=A0A5B8G0X0_9RHOB|nr:phosphoenolpyruvate--protein phosphotransferase [Paroceanicella profunda]QDL93664.1 phosphoenolpyruvate--protein phosphotransferase [Paroceanicella profunda]